MMYLLIQFFDHLFLDKFDKFMIMIFLLQI